MSTTANTPQSGTTTTATIHQYSLDAECVGPEITITIPVPTVVWNAIAQDTFGADYKVVHGDANVVPTTRRDESLDMQVW